MSPSLGLYRELLHEKLCDPKRRWAQNDLTDHEVDAHVAARAAHGHNAKEEAPTEILLVAAADRVLFVEFNRTHEASVGADWLGMGPRTVRLGAEAACALILVAARVREGYWTSFVILRRIALAFDGHM